MSIYYCTYLFKIKNKRVATNKIVQNGTRFKLIMFCIEKNVEI